MLKTDAMLDEVFDAFDHPCWIIKHSQADMGLYLIDIKNNFVFECWMECWMRLTASPNISHNILFEGMRRTLSKLILYDLTTIFLFIFGNLLSKSAILTSGLLYGYFQSL